MKPNYTKLSIVILAIFYIAFAIFFLYGCSAQYHFTKFINKGGKIEQKTEYIETTDTIKVNGKDSIIFVQMPLNCPDVQIPPTRTEIRYKYKLQRDSIKTVRYVTKWKTKEVVKTKRIETKSKSKWLFWFGVGILTAIVIRQVFINLIKKL